MSQEAVLPQHSRAADHDHSDVWLAAHGGHPTVPKILAVQLRYDSGPGLLGGRGVPDADGHPGQPGGQNGRRVHHLGAEGGQLRSLLEGQDTHRTGRGHHAGVRGHDAHDVLPDLHLRSLDGRTDDRGGQVRTISAQCRDNPSSILCDVPCNDGHICVVSPQRGEIRIEVRVGLRQHRALREGRVRTAPAAGRQHPGLPTVDGLGLDATLLGQVIE
mmetsp:Transcript_63365/g.181809  ORF Transcript_63365/g.181809 Transcript_63365/m.181809 type:complete len:216 (+) Transcript_63365:395-1042(+)